MTSRGWTVRAATPADAESIARVEVASWRAAYEGLLPSDLIAAHTIAGFLTCGPTRDADDAGRKVGEVYAVYVAPD